MVIFLFYADDYDHVYFALFQVLFIIDETRYYLLINYHGERSLNSKVDVFVSNLDVVVNKYYNCIILQLIASHSTGDDRIVKHLIRAGADKNHVTKSGVSLHNAVQQVRANSSIT